MDAPAMDTSTAEQVSNRPNLSQAMQLVVCEAMGDPAKITGPADTQVEPSRQTMPSETRPKPSSSPNDREPDPFSQIFAGENMAKLPNRPLHALGTKFFTKAEEWNVILDDDATVYWGAACVTLVQAGIEPGTSFFEMMCQRLSLRAEKTSCLGDFLAALYPGMSCEKTASGYRVVLDGKQIEWTGPVVAQHYVDFFILAEGVRWQTSARRGSQGAQGPSRPPDQLLQPVPQAAPLAPKGKEKKRSAAGAFLEHISPIKRKERKLRQTEAPPLSGNEDKDETSRSRAFLKKFIPGKEKKRNR